MRLIYFKECNNINKINHIYYFQYILFIRPSKELKQTWTLVNKVKLNTNVSKIEFFSSSNPVKNHVKSVEWIGRHFTVINLFIIACYYIFIYLRFIRVPLRN